MCTGTFCPSKSNSSSQKGGKRKCRVILLENVIEHYLDVLFLNHEIICSAPYRIMRNADLSIDEDDAEDLLKEMKTLLKMRQWGEVIKFEHEERMINVWRSI